LSLSSAWLAPLNRGSLNNAHIRGTDVPVEEPSTASNSEVGARNRHVRFPPDSDQTADIAGGPFRAITGSNRVLFDQLVGFDQHWRWDCQSQHAGGS